MDLKHSRLKAFAVLMACMFISSVELAAINKRSSWLRSVDNAMNYEAINEPVLSKRPSWHFGRSLNEGEPSDMLKGK